MDTMEYYSAMKKDEMSPFATTRVDPHGIVLTEGSQTEKDTSHMISLIAGISRKKYTSTRETDS